MRRDVEQAIIVMLAFIGAIIAVGTIMWAFYA